MAALTAALALGTIALAAKGQYDQQKAAKKAAQKQKEEQDALQTDLDAQKTREDKQKADLALRVSLRSAASSSGVPKRSTILTSPIGVPDTAPTPTKTLLGL